MNGTDLLLILGPLVLLFLGVLFSATVRTFIKEVFGHPLRTSKIKRKGRHKVEVERS